MIWLNQIVQGILLGGFYALLASGLSLMFGVMRIINLAHGDLAVLGAFFLYVLANDGGMSPWAALAVVLPSMAAGGWLLQRTMLERSLRAGVLVPLLTTLGLGIVVQNLLFEDFGADQRSLFSNIGALGYDSWRITSQISIGKLSALIFAVAVAVLVALQLFLTRTPLGRALRATAEDPDTAQLVGVDARRVYALAAAIAVAVAALAGVFLAMQSSIQPYSGPGELIFAFETVVIGGLGSLWGTLAGGIVLGVAQNVGAQIDPSWPLLAGHVVFLAVLAARVVLGEIGSRGGLQAVLGRV
ncbi:MAG TPA: branched-chain amino acid ABC transporter permease [Gaiellaceae bacterium]|nr:branched-chain amino acid ABC transporter permease [Gaiellaceae bacterium]